MNLKVHEKIKKYLEENGIKQKYVAIKANIPENIFSMMMNGTRKIDVDEFVDIVTALGTDANYFIL